MTAGDGLIYAFLLDGKGGGIPQDWDSIRDWHSDKGVLWVHLDYTKQDSKHWLMNDSGLEPLVVDALMAEETRPRISSINDGRLISLRGVNSNPGADPEDMVSIRLFCTKDRVISTRRRTLLSVSDLVDALHHNNGPCNTGELIARLTERLASRMSEIITELEERMDGYEENIISGAGQEMRKNILEIRGEIIKLRRYLAPQREAMIRLFTDTYNLLSEHDKLQVREVSDKITRYVEELDSIKDRASVAYEELSSRLAEQMNNRMYVLSLVAGLFLPLGFLTGLLGINVGGIPLAENSMGFLGVVVFLIVLVIAQIIIFKRKNWF
jgi:zinc transporter